MSSKKAGARYALTLPARDAAAAGAKPVGPLEAWDESLNTRKSHGMVVDVVTQWMRCNRQICGGSVGLAWRSGGEVCGRGRLDHHLCEMATPRVLIHQTKYRQATADRSVLNPSHSPRDHLRSYCVPKRRADQILESTPITASLWI